VSGRRVFVGMGACIGVRHPGEHVRVGDDAVIGAGALVMRSVPDGVKVLGVWA
jgi:serine acetyltransferase